MSCGVLLNMGHDYPLHHAEPSQPALVLGYDSAVAIHIAQKELRAGIPLLGGHGATGCRVPALGVQIHTLFEGRNCRRSAQQGGLGAVWPGLPLSTRVSTGTMRVTSTAAHSAAKMARVVCCRMRRDSVMVYSFRKG